MPAATWHILGAGSIGTLSGARLLAAGLPVMLCLRDAAQVAALRAAGLTVHWPDGRVQQLQPQTVAIADAHATLLLTCTKSMDTVTALAGVVRGDGDGQLALLLQNGMGSAEAVRTRWPRLRLWCGITTAGAWRASPFELHCVATGHTDAGRHDDAGDAALDAHVAALAAAGLMTLHHDIRPLLWQKLVVNACINGLTALHDCRNGELLARADLHAAMRELATEADAIAAAAGIALPVPALAAAEQVARQTARNFSSMNRDMAAGRRTEIDAINGYLVQLATQYGLPCPAQRRLLAAIHARTPQA